MAASISQTEGRKAVPARQECIPRTLVGLGGARLYDMPGVVYPAGVLHARKGYERGSGTAYREVPEWGISTQQAARVLGCSDAAARRYLHRHKVPFRVVAAAGRPCINYWRRSCVLALVKDRGEIVKRCPARMVDAEQAMKLLGVGRSTLQRYVQAGRLRQVKLRLLTGQGLKNRAYFLRSHVLVLAARIRAVRAKEKEWHRLLAQAKCTCGP